MQVISIPYSKIEEIGFEITSAFSLTNKNNVITKSGKHELEFDKLANVKEFYTILSRHVCA